MPAYPFVAILAGWYIDKVLRSEIKRPFIRPAYWSYLVITTALPLILYFLLEKDPLLSHLKNISGYFLILPAGAVLALIFIYRNKILYSILSLSVSWIVVTLMFFYFLFPKIDRENPVAKILPRIDRSEPVAVYGLYNSAFSFYLKKPFTPLSDSTELAAFAASNKGGYIISRKRQLPEIRKVKGLKVIAEEKDIFEIPTTVVLQVVKSQ